VQHTQRANQRLNEREQWDALHALAHGECADSPLRERVGEAQGEREGVGGIESLMSRILHVVLHPVTVGVVFQVLSLQGGAGGAGVCVGGACGAQPSL